MIPYDRALIFEAPDADPQRDRVVRQSPAGRTTIVAVSDSAEVVAIAAELADAGARLVELCGGVSPVWRSRAKRALGARARVSSATFGIESLGAAARFNQAFNEGKETKQAFILLEPGANPDADRFVMTPDTIPTPVIPVPDEDAAARVAASLADEDVLLIELFGGFTTGGIERVIAAVDGRSAVGAGSFAVDEVEIGS